MKITYLDSMDDSDFVATNVITVVRNGYVQNMSEL